VCLALVGSALLSVGSAAGQTLQYDVGIDFPNFVQFWYWDRIDIDISAAQLANAMFGGSSLGAGPKSTFGAFAGSLIEADSDIGSVVDDAGDPTDPLWLGVANAWAMRSVSASGLTQISIDITRRVARGPRATDRIRVTEAEVVADGVRGSTVVIPDTGRNGGFWGETWLRVDLSRARRAGLYSGIVLEITVENI
jgi:hypothetical protein